MAAPTARPPADGDSEQSLGSLVSVAVKDLTQLVRYEVDLAKLELKDDARRIGIGIAMVGLAGYVCSLVLVLLLFALVYGLITLGIWPWAAFLIVAGASILFASLAVLIGVVKVRRVSGLRKTRSTVQDYFALMRRDNGAAVPPAGGAG